MLKKKIFKYGLYVLPVLIAISLSWFDVFKTFELQTYDFRFKLRPALKTHPDIVLIEISNDTIDKLGWWPFDRDYHASLVDVLTELGAKAIIFDVVFSEPGRGDEELAVSCKKADNVYFPVVLRLPKKSSPGLYNALDIEMDLIPQLKDSAHGLGHINALPDPDGKRRRIPLFITYKNQHIPFLSLKLGLDILGIKTEDVIIKRGCIELNPRIKIPVDKNANMLINFAGKWTETFEHYSYVDILAAYLQRFQGQKPIIDLSKLKNKICFIGLTATASLDLAPTPIEPAYPMVGAHANMLNSILLNNFIARAPKWLNLIVLFVLVVLILFVLFKTKIFVGLISLCIILLVFISLAVVLFIFAGIWIDVFSPVVISLGLYFVGTLYRYLDEQKKRLLIDKELSIAQEIQLSFLPKEVPASTAVEIGVSLRTVKAVGGDLYDFVDFSSIDKNKIGLVIGDVSGKGMPAALFMAMSISYFRFLSKNNISTVDVITQLNQRLVTEVHSGLFITIFYMIYDTNTHELSYTDGGHLPALLIRKDASEVTLLTTQEGMLVGTIKDVSFGQEKIKLEKGDLIIQYTDGITEARNTKIEEFGLERFKSAALKYRNLASQDIAQGIQQEVITFAGKRPKHDDSAVLVLKIKE